MERYFTLDKYNTWYDWGLIVTEKSVTPPEPKTNYVDLDGMSGSLDLSEALTGEITYKDRKIVATFITDNGTRKDRERLLRDIRLAIHGKKIKIIEPDDPDHYFYGRVSIKSESNTLAYMEIEIEATCDPWRYSVEESSRNVTVEGETNVVINNHGAKTLCPEIVSTGTVHFSYGEIELDLLAGSYKISAIRFYPGVNLVNLSGSGTVTFIYKEADL